MIRDVQGLASPRLWLSHGELTAIPDLPEFPASHRQVWI